MVVESAMRPAARRHRMCGTFEWECACGLATGRLHHTHSLTMGRGGEGRADFGITLPV